MCIWIFSIGNISMNTFEPHHLFSEQISRTTISFLFQYLWFLCKIYSHWVLTVMKQLVNYFIYYCFLLFALGCLYILLLPALCFKLFIAVFSAYCLLLTANCLLLTAYCLLLSAYCSLFIVLREGFQQKKQ